jgi:hypothetical protein
MGQTESRIEFYRRVRGDNIQERVAWQRTFLKEKQVSRGAVYIDVEEKDAESKNGGAE